MKVEQQKQQKTPLFKLIMADKTTNCFPDYSIASTKLESNGPKIEVTNATFNCNNTFKCHVDACSRTFSYLYQLRKHLSFVHKVHFYDCSRCGFRFKKYSSYMKHMKCLLSCETAKIQKSLEIHQAHAMEDALKTGLQTANQLLEQFSLDKITEFNEKLIHQHCTGIDNFSLILKIN